MGTNLTDKLATMSGLPWLGNILCMIFDLRMSGFDLEQQNPLAENSVVLGVVVLRLETLVDMAW